MLFKTHFLILSQIYYTTLQTGKYYECYYVILRIRNNGLKIYKHTIPSFIPIDEIAKLLNKNIKVSQ